MADLPSWFAAPAAALLGLLFGSFANVAIHRWPRGATVFTPRGSRCPSCDAPVAARDNVPVLSWLLLRGRCRRCGAAIASRYLWVEVATAVSFAVVTWTHDVEWILVPLLILTWALVVATVVDLEHRIIPNKLTYRLPLVLLPLLGLSAWQADAWVDLRRGVIAGIAVPGVMLLLSESFRLLRGQQGIGMGDIKLALSIGLVIGYLGGWELVVFAYATMISGVLIAFGLMAAGRASLATRIPYGPYLAVGSMTAIVAGEPLRSQLQTWLGL